MPKDNEAQFATMAEKLAALAEILWQNVPSDPAKTATVKRLLLQGFKRQELLCNCGARHEIWIQAVVELEKMIAEMAAEGDPDELEQISNKQVTIQ